MNSIKVKKFIFGWRCRIDLKVIEKEMENELIFQ